MKLLKIAKINYLIRSRYFARKIQSIRAIQGIGLAGKTVKPTTNILIRTTLLKFKNSSLHHVFNKTPPNQGGDGVRDSGDRIGNVNR